MRRSPCSVPSVVLAPIAAPALAVASVVFVAIAVCSPARADAMAECSGRGEAHKKIEACGRVIDGPAAAADKAKAHRIRGEARLSAGAGEEAIADFTAALALDGRDAASYAGRGQARLTRNDTGLAIGDFSEAIRLAPRTAFYRNARGHAHLVSGNAEAAAEDFTEALQLDPNSANALNNRGLARMKLGNAAAAIADYTLSIGLNPLYALAYNNRGYAHESTGAKAEAAADFQAALKIDPTLAGARAGLARLGAASTETASSDALAREGKRLADKNCAWCHATGVKGASPNAKAPPFRSIASRHPVLALREPLSRGIAAPHDQMPNFKMPDADVDKIIAYIDSLAIAPR